MGNSLSTCLGYLIIFYLKLKEKAEDVFKNKKQNKKGYYNNDILLKDEEHHASKLIFVL